MCEPNQPQLRAILMRMRVIAGEFRSRRLLAPAGQSTRPTSDKLRETLFNVLGPRVHGARFADLYAGSGAVGIEALSRGASFCHFAERSAAAWKALRNNLDSLHLAARTVVDSRGTAPLLRDLSSKTALLDVVFLDPPYSAAAEYTATLALLAEHARSLLAPDAIVIAEHARKSPAQPAYESLIRYRVLEQGDAALSFYRIENTHAE